LKTPVSAWGLQPLCIEQTQPSCPSADGKTIREAGMIEAGASAGAGEMARAIARGETSATECVATAPVAAGFA
jgi:hypothetical protein